jgi:hypothetical protein
LDHRDRDNPLGLLEIMDEIDGCVIDREVIVLGSVGGGAQIIPETRCKLSKLRITRVIVWDPDHASRKLR